MSEKKNNMLVKRVSTFLIIAIVVIISVFNGGKKDNKDLKTEDITNAESDSIATKNATEKNTSSTQYKFRYEDRLTQHYNKHNEDFGYASQEEYEQHASDVVNNPKALHKTEKEDGDDVYFLESTGEFVIVAKGTNYIRTYFKPSAGKAYFDRQ